MTNITHKLTILVVFFGALLTVSPMSLDLPAVMMAGASLRMAWTYIASADTPSRKSGRKWILE